MRDNLTGGRFHTYTEDLYIKERLSYRCIIYVDHLKGEVLMGCGDGIYELSLYDHSRQSCCGESLWDLYGGTHFYEKANEVLITRGALLMLFEDENLKNAIISSY